MPESHAKKLESSLADFDGNQIKKTKLQITSKGDETLVTSDRTGLLKLPFVKKRAKIIYFNQGWSRPWS